MTYDNTGRNFRAVFLINYAVDLSQERSFILSTPRVFWGVFPLDMYPGAGKKPGSVVYPLNGYEFVSPRSGVRRDGGLLVCLEPPWEHVFSLLEHVFSL